MPKIVIDVGGFFGAICGLVSICLQLAWRMFRVPAPVESLTARDASRMATRYATLAALAFLAAFGAMLSGDPFPTGVWAIAFVVYAHMRGKFRRPLVS